MFSLLFRIGAIAMFVAACTTDSRSPAEQFIDYRGGLVRFSLPAKWVAEYSDEGGGVFWNPDANGGTLRLNVLTFEKNSEGDPYPALSMLDSLSGEGVVRQLASGDAIREYTETSEENGKPIKLFFWEVSNFVEPKYYRLAIFSYTILETEEEHPTIQNEIAILTQQIPKVRFSAEVGRLQ